MPTTVFFATNRSLTGPADELGSYGNDIQPQWSSTGITFGTAFVEGIDVDKNVQGTVGSIQDTKNGSFEQGVFDDLAEAGRNLLVFVHGFDARHFGDRVQLAIAWPDSRLPTAGRRLQA